MEILKRQLALMLVFAMTLTMLPMPAHADEVTEPETPSAIVEETTVQAVVSNEEVSTDTANKPVEIAEPDAAAKETAAPTAEIAADTAVDSNTATTEELVTDVSEDTPVSDSVEESEKVIETDDTAENGEVGENAESDFTVESEEDSKADTQEETDQAEPETEAPVTVLFSIRKSVANAAATECAHSETEIAWDTKDQVINCKSISDTQHQISGYQYRYCTSCYQRVGESFAATEVASHELDNSGYCSWCGYRSSTGSGSGSGSGSDPDCDHANTAIGWDPDQLGPWYAQYSDTQHKVTGYRYTYCTDCHARIRDESGSNNNYYSEEVEGHTLNASGECTLCGYGQKATCNHLRDSSSGEVSYTDPPRYEKCNEDTHYIYRPTYYDCIYCGEPMDEPGYTIRNEAHTPENGVCIYCGENVGKDYCFHSATDTAWDTTQPIYYSIYSSTQHQIRGFEYTYCTNCFERIGESFWSQQLEGHVLSADGVCTLCSYGSNTCAHENVVFGYAPVYDPPRYEQYDDSQHFVYHIMQKTCRDCGETLSDGEEAVSLENHVLDDGKCTYCGYGLGEDYCTHPGTDVAWDTNYPITYTKINNDDLSGTLHQAEGYQYHYCTSCYKRICDSFPVAEWENHTFDAAGDCTLCDYRVGCEHKQTTMKLYNTLYESLNKDSHEVTRLYSKVCADPDCGKVLVSVETSYTETDIEDHDFTGNTCLLCNYTVAAQLSATVTVSAQTANKGDHISATASVVGGTGGYRFSWKILKDGSVVAENPITTSASCGTNAYEEGSYVFQVTVTDSGGNTVTAQSGAITVSHACQYETVTSTELVIQSETHHTVETTTYEECSVCHAKTEEVKDVEWVEHTPIDANSYAYEAAHPHKKYFICECKAHPYLEGQHETANGTVQEPDVCCICHGHKYGTEEETDEGTRQKTCVNCGLTTVTHTHEYELIQTEKLINPDATKHYAEITSKHKCKTCGHEKPGIVMTIEEAHSPKNPDDYKFRDGHPHLRYAVCECGKEFDMQDEYKTANGTMQAPEVCCLCHGHVFGEPTEINSVIWKVICSVCGYEGRVAAPSQTETETTEPTVNADEKQELKDYNIDFIKKNALGKNDIYTLFFNDELRAEIEELSEGLASKAYDLIDGDPTAHLALSQAEFYVDTLMKQCADLDTDGDTIKVSTVVFDEMCKAFESICKDLGIYDTVYKVFVELFVTRIYTDGTYNKKDIILTKKQFENQIDQHDFKVLEDAKEGIKIGTYLWKCLKDISVYSAAMIGPASGMIDAAKVQWEDTSAGAALAYLELCTNPAMMPSYVMLKNADLAEGIRGSIADKVLANPMLKLSFETTLYLNDLVFSVNDILKSNHGTYWSLQLVDEMYEGLNTAIKKYERNPSDENYTECMETYSLYITYLVSAYQGVIDTRENYSSTLAGEMMTTHYMQQKNKELNNQYKAILEWYKYDISAAINDFSIEKVIKEIEAVKD